MLDILHFIFKDFWHWLGTMFLLETIGGVAVKLFKRREVIVDESIKNDDVR